MAKDKDNIVDIAKARKKKSRAKKAKKAAKAKSKKPADAKKAKAAYADVMKEPELYDQWRHATRESPEAIGKRHLFRGNPVRTPKGVGLSGGKPGSLAGFYNLMPVSPAAGVPTNRADLISQMEGRMRAQVLADPRRVGQVPQANFAQLMRQAAQLDEASKAALLARGAGSLSMREGFKGALRKPVAPALSTLSTPFGRESLWSNAAARINRPSFASPAGMPPLGELRAPLFSNIELPEYGPRRSPELTRHRGLGWVARMSGAAPQAVAEFTPEEMAAARSAAAQSLIDNERRLGIPQVSSADQLQLPASTSDRKARVRLGGYPSSPIDGGGGSGGGRTFVGGGPKRYGRSVIHLPGGGYSQASEPGFRGWGRSGTSGRYPDDVKPAGAYDRPIGPKPKVPKGKTLGSLAEAAKEVAEEGKGGWFKRMPRGGKLGLLAAGLAGVGTAMYAGLSGDNEPEQPFVLPPPGGDLGAGAGTGMSGMEQYYMSLLADADDQDQTDMYDLLREDLEANIAQQKAAADSVYAENRRYLGDVAEAQRIANKNWDVMHKDMQAQLDREREEQIADAGGMYLDPDAQATANLAQEMAIMSEEERAASQADYDYGAAMLNSDDGLDEQISAMMHARYLDRIDREGADRLQELQMEQLRQENEQQADLMAEARRFLGDAEIARIKEGVNPAEGIFIEESERPRYLQKIIGDELAAVQPNPYILQQAGLDDPNSVDGRELLQEILDRFLVTGDSRYLTEYLQVGVA